LINYYKILQVPDFSDAKTVQRSYRKLAKQYHPDTSSDQETVELFKLISSAYSTLSDPTEKLKHDRDLRFALLYDKTKGEVISSTDDIRKRQTAWSKRKRDEEVRSYERKNKLFPYKYRIPFFLIIAFWGLQIVYSYWFVNLSDFSGWWLTIGFLLFVSASVFFLSSIFTYYRMKTIIENKKVNYENLSWYLFLGLLIMGPSFVLGLNTIRKEYHLANYAVVERAHIDDLKYSRIVYSFSPDGIQTISKSSPIEKYHIFDMNQKWIMLEYSKADPRITRLLRKTEK